MKVMLKQSLGMLALILWVTGCANTPFSQQPASKKPVTKAPVVDRSTRQQPAGTYGRQPSPQVEIGQVPEEDPLVPREYSSAYPAPSAYPRGGAQPPSAYPRGGAQSPPAYPPGAATQYPPASRPYSASPADGYGGTASPAPGALPEPQPVVPRTPRTPPKPADAPPAPASTPEPTPEPASAPVPEPAQPPVAMATPPAAPSAPKPARPAPPADLPPAEITREGNQAVAALLDSADKYVKSNQLDKAGAALERALRIEPRNAGIWHDLAQIRLHQSEYQQAESLASKSNNLAAGNRTLQARNWKVIASARKASGNVGGAEEAEARASQLSH